MNNNFSALCRYLIDRGYSATLFVLDGEPKHFHPFADSYDDAWKHYTVEVSWGNIYEGSIREIRDQVFAQLDEYDVLIGCGYAPAFVRLIGRKLDFFIPYGEDIISIPFLKLTHPKRLLRNLIMSTLQARAIRGAGCICMAPTGGMLEKYLDRLKVDDERILTCGVPMVYWPQYDMNNFLSFGSDSDILQTVLKYKEDGYVVLLHPSRHCWKNSPDEPSKKGNDQLFVGMAQAAQERPGIKLKLLTFEYGVDVDESKKLAVELSIEHLVDWCPVIERKLLTRVMYEVDAVVGELHHAYFSYGVVYESMALAKPLIHNRGDAYKKYYAKQYPMLQASSSSDVSEAILRLIDKPEEVGEVGKGAQSWMKEHLVRGAVDSIESALSNAR